MRIALLLLLALAVASVPGTIIPQRPQSPAMVAQWYLDRPGVAAVFDRVGLFDIYAAPWFAAIYILLMISLVGCIVPRSVAHAKALRRPPPRAPASFGRMPARRALVTTLSVAETVAAARAGLRGHRVRQEDGATVTLSAERGYARESGNLLFHLAVVGLLIAVGYGTLVHYRGQVLVVVGDTFVNSRIDYGSFNAGPWFDESNLETFRLRVDDFTSEFNENGEARDFEARVTLLDKAEGEGDGVLRVNRPLRAGGAGVFLMGNGFAPQVEVFDSAGALAFSGAVPFLPDDNVSYVSQGVVKVPDTSDGIQLGLNGWFLPTGVVDENGMARSIWPEPRDPVLVLNVWYGNLGLDDGTPQNVYQLDTRTMTQVMFPSDGGEDPQPYRLVVRPGERVALPEGLGSIEFESLPRFVGLDVRYDPTLPWVLGAALLAFAGLTITLFTPRRRVFLRIGVDADGQTVVAAAAMARGQDLGLDASLDRALRPLSDAVRAAHTAPESREIERTSQA